MSVIQGTRSSSLIEQLRKTAGTSSSGQIGGQKSLEAKLDTDLGSLGLSQDERKSIKTDLKSALQQAFGSGTSAPDPEALQSAVKSVFEKHGLNADELSQKFGPPPGGPPGGGIGGGFGPISGPGGSGPSSSGDSSSTKTDSTQSLLDILNQYLEKLSSSNSKNGSTDELLNRLLGFDAKA